MEFGRTDYNTLSKKEFEFPLLKQEVLNGKTFPKANIHIGLPKWFRIEWMGNIIPPGIKERNGLEAYSKKFSCVELNATHYKIYGEEVINKWIEKTPDDFKFCPKFYQGITHRGALNNKQAITDEFIKSIRLFDKKLGASFLQFGEYNTISKKQELIQYLKTFPADIECFVELRHPSWFNPMEQINEIAKELTELKRGWVITDTPGRRDVAHMKLTIPKAFIRFVGEGTNEIDLYRLKQWKGVLTEWYNNGLQECYFMLHILDDTKTHEVVDFIENEFAELLIGK